MAFISNVFQVFIASPSDVVIERNIIREVIYEWNNLQSADKNIVLLPVGWETHSMPLQGDRPQGIINDYLLQNCDVLIGVFWSRIGSETGKAISGTVEEINEFIDKKKPVLLYVCRKPVPPDILDQNQKEKLDSFINQRMKDGLIHSYTEVGDFKAAIFTHLNRLINSHKAFKNIINEIETEDDKTIHPIINKAVIEASKDPEGIINVTYGHNSKDLIANGEVLYSASLSSMREQAELIDLIEDLEFTYGFIKEKYTTQDGEVYTLTIDGYKYVDEIKDSNDVLKE